MKYFTVTTAIVLGLAFTAGLLGLIAGSSPNRATSAASSLASMVCSQGPASPPTFATHNLDRYAADWGTYCEMTPTWTITNVAAPSLDGEALKCSLTGGASYSNVHCYRNFRPEPDAAVFTLTVPFQLTPTTTCDNVGAPSVVQALEFSMSKWHRGQRYEFALQWQNVGSDGESTPQWRYWDPSRIPAERWVPISPTINQCLVGGTWYTLTLEGEIVGGQTHYRQFMIDGQSHPLSLTVPRAADLTTPDGLAVAVQLDGNATQSPYDLIVDQVKFLRSPAACSVVYSGGNGWVVDMCPDPHGGAQMEVVLDDVPHGGAGFVRVSHQSQAWPGLPQVAVLYATGYVRLKPNADPSPAIPFGSSFVLGPAYWSGSVYHHHPQLTRLNINTAPLPEGPLRLRAEGANQDLAVTYDMALPPARDRQTRLHVIQTYTATTNITIDPARRAQREGFKLVQVSSMFINQDGTCAGGNTDCHDSDGARFIGSDLARHQVAFTSITPSAFVFSSTVPLGSTWFDALHTDDQSWQGNTPNVRIALDALPITFTITPQGWISATTDPNADNVGLWLHDDGPASQGWTAGQRGQIGYWLIAQDNPPDPWADLGLRTGLTFLDFESSYNCFVVKDARQATTGAVSAISGYTDRALQMSYDLGTEDGNWVQIRCNFDPPLDLSANDHLRLDWRGDRAAANSLQVGLIDADGHIFARGYHHPTHRAWWGQLVIPFSFLEAWTAGTTFDPSQVSAVIISVVLDPVDDVGGAGRIAVDNLGAYNVISRNVPGFREPVRGNRAASTAAANWIATQQRPTGLVKSWEEETICNAHTYDQALALIVFAREGMWAQANALVDALVRVQGPDGSWSKSHNCDTTAPVDGTKWEGDIAWAVYALSRYQALGGAHPGANAAMLKGAAWLANRVSPTDGCLVIDHTEATLDAWWAFQSAGPDYADQAAQVKSCLLADYWDESMGRLKGGKNWWQPYLDNQTWGAAFLRSIREEFKAQRALSYARQVLLTPAQGGQLFGFDGQGGPWSVWNEGTGQYIAVCGAGARDLLTGLLAQQRADGAMPGSPDEFSGGGVWTTRWHGIAPTAWLYNGMNGEPFGAATQCHSIYLPIVLRN